CSGDRWRGGRRGMKVKLSSYGRQFIGLLDACIITSSLVLAWVIRYDFWIPRVQVRLLVAGLSCALPIKMAVFLLGGLYRSIWRFADTTDFSRLFVVNLFASSAF